MLQHTDSAIMNFYFQFFTQLICMVVRQWSITCLCCSIAVKFPKMRLNLVSVVAVCLRKINSVGDIDLKMIRERRGYLGVA